MKELEFSDGLVALDLGCGNKKRKGTIGVDIGDHFDIDVKHDLNVMPYPFEDNSVDRVYIDNCLEHLDNPLRVIEEIHRILKNGAYVKVIVPYFRSPSAFHDPTHKTHYTTQSFFYYDPSHVMCQRYKYTKAHFNVEKILFHENLKSGAVKSLVVKFANKYSEVYENYLSTVLPLHEISFYLQKLVVED